MEDQAAWKSAIGRAGERGGARAGKPRCVSILTITAGSSMAEMILSFPPHTQRSTSRSKTRRRAVRVFVCGLASILRCTRHDRGTQPGIGRQHAMETEQMQARSRHQGG